MATPPALGPDAAVMLSFRLGPDDVQALVQERVARGLARYDRRMRCINAVADRLRPGLLLVAPMVAVVVVQWCSHARGPEPWIASAMVLLLYAACWWRFRGRVLQWADRVRARMRGASRRRLEPALTAIESRAHARLEGVYALHVDPQALRLRSPGAARDAVLPWRRIVSVTDDGRFYRIATRMTQRFGRAYLVARHSGEMAQPDYERGLARLLRACPVPVQPRSTTP